jgi:hypothetical protein
MASKKESPKPLYIVAVDVEASTSILGPMGLVAIGAVLMECSGPMRLVETFEAYVNNGNGQFRFDSDCLCGFWAPLHMKDDKNLDRLKFLHGTMAKVSTRGMSEEDVMKKFVDFCRRCAVHSGGPENVTLVTDTTGFDIAWIDWALGQANIKGVPSSLHVFGGSSPRFPRSTTSMILGLAMASDPTITPLSDSSDALKTLGIVVPDSFQGVTHDHNPVNDATMIAYEFAYVYNEITKAASFFV